MKNNVIKQKRVINEDMTNVRNMFVILGIVVIVCLGLYFLTEKISKKEETLTEKEVTIDYDIATVGTMFNRVENEYYVLIYSNEENGTDLNSILDTYRSSDDYIKTYYVDLDNKMNSSAISDETVKKPTTSLEVKVNGPTMYKIKDHKVTNCYIGVDDIIKVIEVND